MSRLLLMTTSGLLVSGCHEVDYFIFAKIVGATNMPHIHNALLGKLNPLDPTRLERKFNWFSTSNIFQYVYRLKGIAMFSKRALIVVRLFPFPTLLLFCHRQTIVLFSSYSKDGIFVSKFLPKKKKYHTMQTKQKEQLDNPIKISGINKLQVSSK